jgi:hypothetical protein
MLYDYHLKYDTFGQPLNTRFRTQNLPQEELTGTTAEEYVDAGLRRGYNRCKDDVHIRDNTKTTKGRIRDISFEPQTIKNNKFIITTLY